MNQIDLALLANSNNAELPLRSLLHDSVYYPAAGLDGDPIKYLSKRFASFVYVDYGIASETIESELQNFTGYRVKKFRSVALPKSRSPTSLIASTYAFDCFGAKRRYQKDPFCLWSIHERLPNFGPGHGPEYFSMLYVGGEGVAMFERLYFLHRSTPAVIAIIQPGTAFGKNWTDFEDRQGPLARAVMGNPFGTPAFLLHGGWADGSDYRRPCWLEFDQPQGVLHGRLRFWGRDLKKSVSCQG